ncbi:MAG: hypothetical protein FWH04_08990, partial [Oscillospiraceae bacterium]|nr:hypothetical protein [Oscillospiraceae bacterium]
MKTGAAATTPVFVAVHCPTQKLLPGDISRQQLLLCSQVFFPEVLYSRCLTVAGFLPLRLAPIQICVAPGETAHSIFG